MKRARLVPVAARTPVREVMAAARRHSLARRERVMLCTFAFRDNIDDSDADALGDLIEDTPVRLDLIEVTDSSGEFRARHSKNSSGSATSSPASFASPSSADIPAVPTSRPPAVLWRAKVEIRPFAQESHQARRFSGSDPTGSHRQQNFRECVRLNNSCPHARSSSSVSFR